MAGESVRAIEDAGKRPWHRPEVAFPPTLRARARAMAAEEAARAGIEVVAGVRALSATYTQERDRLTSLPASVARYVGGLGFFFARDLPKAISVADELAMRGRLKTRALRILDLGAGLGTTSLGIARYVHAAGLADEVRIDAVEQDAGALLRMQRLAAPCDELPALELRTHARDLMAHLRADENRYDLVTIGLAINELAPSIEGRRATLRAAIDRLADDGVVLVIEPALHATARALMALRDAMLEGERVPLVGPCTHTAPCPMRHASDRDWCHVELPLELPDEEAAVAREAGLRDVKPTFAWLAFGRGEDPGVDVALHRLVSRALASKGKTEMHVCGHGQLRRITALDRDRIEPPLGALRRGGLVALDEPEGPPRAVVRLGRDATLRRIVP